MKFQRLVITCAGGALLSASVSAGAGETWETQSMGTFDFSANVALTSDYIWRYVSQSDEKGAIQGGFDVSHSTGLYAGTWGSNVDFNDGGASKASFGDASMELDLYGGFAHEFDNGLGLDVGIINYRYPGESSLNWIEYHGGVSYTLWGVGLNASAHYSTEAFNLNNGTFYTGGAEYTFDTAFPITVSGDAGYYTFSDGTARQLSGDSNNDSYVGWHVGASMDVKGFVFDASYYDTNSDGKDIFGGDWAGSHAVVSVSKSF